MHTTLTSAGVVIIQIGPGYRGRGLFRDTKTKKKKNNNTLVSNDLANKRTVKRIEEQTGKAAITTGVCYLFYPLIVHPSVRHFPAIATVRVTPETSYT